MKGIARIFALLCALFIAQQAVAITSPVNMLQGVADNVMGALKKEGSSLQNNPSRVYQIINRLLLPHVDVTGMSRSVLGRNAWRKANGAERKRFSHEFTRLVVRTYASALASYTNERIEFKPLREDFNKKKRMRVYSRIVRPGGSPIALNYRVARYNEQWKIYDMSVEGVSLLQSYRSQFSRELNSMNLNQLINKLADHNKKTYAR